MLGDDAAHDGVEVLAGLFEDEGAARIVPAELEAGGERGDPDFADGRVGGDHEFGFLGFLEDDFEFSGLAFDVETVLVAESEQALLEIIEGCVSFALKIFFLQHEFSVHEQYAHRKRQRGRASTCEKKRER